MPAIARPRPAIRPRSALIRRFVGCGRGAVAVEMAMLLWPMIALVMGILQLVIIQYTQVLLNDALHTTASNPEPEVLAGNAALYKARVCAKITIMSSVTCNSRLLVEMMQLSTVSASATPVTGASFSAGNSNDVMLLRAGLPVTRFLPFIPQVTTKASVVFRRL